MKVPIAIVSCAAVIAISTVIPNPLPLSSRLVPSVGQTIAADADQLGILEKSLELPICPISGRPLKLTDGSKTGSHMILDFRRMGFMKTNDFGLGPEGTSHKSPARCAGIESK